MKLIVVSYFMCIDIGSNTFYRLCDCINEQITHDSQDVPRIWYNSYGHIHTPVTSVGYIIGLYEKYKNIGNQASNRASKTM
jgi:hypothetical protein